jgi:hypothetical protein
MQAGTWCCGGGAGPTSAPAFWRPPSPPGCSSSASAPTTRCCLSSPPCCCCSSPSSSSGPRQHDCSTGTVRYGRLFPKLLKVINNCLTNLNEVQCRPEPPIPQIRVSQQAIDQVAALLHSGLNTLFSAFHDIALGKDSLLFCQVFLCLWIISIIASLTDFPTFCYACN